MKTKKIQSMLKQAVEREIPSSQIDLWRAVQAELVAGKHPLFQQGAKMNTLKRRAAFAALTIVLLLAAALLTPQGRTLAEDVVPQFFTRTESDSYKTEPYELEWGFETPFQEECGIVIFPRCSVEEIRNKVDFEVKEPAILPEGMFYQGATGGPDGVGLSYLYRDRDRLGGQLSVSVEPASKPVDPYLAAKSANVEKVLIGSLPGEFIKGALFQDEHGNVTWLPNDPQMTLRWQDGGSMYTLYYYSTRYPLTKEDLVRIAESMTLEPVSK
ncbi:MAG TPA: DUF4367 domain-containing protein [Anaerolineales bacterium]|nr:DUF4367 domain-containing protein [Anaerolineales bacterium]